MSGSMMRYGRLPGCQEVAMAMQASCAGGSAGLARFRRLLFRRHANSGTRAPAGDAQAGLDLRLPGSPARADRQARCRAAALHEPAHGPPDGPADPPKRRARTSRSSRSDGQPTAHVQAITSTCSTRPIRASTVATLKEACSPARRLPPQHLRADRSYWEWLVGFVDQLTKLTKGFAFYTTAANSRAASWRSI